MTLNNYLGGRGCRRAVMLPVGLYAVCGEFQIIMSDGTYYTKLCGWRNRLK